MTRRLRISGIIWTFDPLKLADELKPNSYDHAGQGFDDVKSSQDVDGVLCILFPDYELERGPLWLMLCRYLGFK